MTNFQSFGLSEILNKSLSAMHYSAPTPIQEKAIPIALQGRDILGSAQTGTGKTAAFSIPLVEALIRSPQGAALVLTPTRELAKQVLTVIHQLLGNQSNIKTAFIIGGEPMGKQFSQLRARPRIIVGTPGRINDHLERGTIKLSDAGFLVLDETDRMLDMGFGVQLDKILKYLPQQRQTLMFSATLPKGIVELAGKYLSNPERISVGATNKLAMNIKQDVIRIDQDKKYKELVSQLHERQGSVIIFVKTKHNADRMAQNLNRDGFEADALHGDLRQRARDRVMREFRSQKFRIMVATDIASRGLDVPHIEHVVNYDMPQVAEDYIHRMGRTARAGAQGSALCFIAPQDVTKWRAIERLLNPDSANDRKETSFGNDRSKNFRKRGPKPFERQGNGNGNRFEKRNDHKGRSAERNGEFKRPERSNVEGARPEYRKPERKNFEGGRPEFKRSERGNAEGARSEYRKPERKNFEGGRPEFKRSERSNTEGARSEYRKPERKFEGRSSEFKRTERSSTEGKRPEYKKPERKNFDNKGGEYKPERNNADNKGGEYRPARKNSEGKKFGNRSADFKKSGHNNSEGRNSENKKGGEKKFGGKPFKKKSFSGKPRPKFAA